MNFEFKNVTEQPEMLHSASIHFVYCYKAGRQLGERMMASIP